MDGWLHRKGVVDGNWTLYEGKFEFGVLGPGLAAWPVCKYRVMIDNTLYVTMKNFDKITIACLFLCDLF